MIKRVLPYPLVEIFSGDVPDDSRRGCGELRYTQGDGDVRESRIGVITLDSDTNNGRVKLRVWISLI